MLVGISPIFVCREQHWLVYLFVVDNNGWFINWFCLSWTILVSISPSVVCRGQYRLVYQLVLSVKEIMACISPDSVCN